MKTNIDEGRIVKALAGFYYIDDGHEVHQCRARGKFRKQDIKPVVGDFVEFQKGNHDDGYLLKILERKNVLRRPPIANIDQALLVFSRKEPDFSTVLLDKFLLLIEHYHIKPIIVISKMDIEGDDSIYQYIQEYRNAGYTVIETSSKQNKGINEIKEIFISGIIGSDVDFLRVIWRWNCCTGSRRNEYSSKFTNFSVFRNRRGLSC